MALTVSSVNLFPSSNPAQRQTQVERRPTRFVNEIEAMYPTNLHIASFAITNALSLDFQHPRPFMGVVREAVIGPCFSTGWQSAITLSSILYPFNLSRPFTGVLLRRLRSTPFQTVERLALGVMLSLVANVCFNPV